MCGRQLHLAKRFGHKMAFFSCRKGYKTNLLYLLLSLGQIKGACKLCLINLFSSPSAEIRKDTSSQYQSALLLGDVEERVKILKSAGQSERGTV